MGMNKFEVHDLLLRRRTNSLFDDFNSYTDAELWTKLVADGGTAAATDADSGILAMATNNSDNDEIAVNTTQKLYIIAANKPMYFESRLQFSDSNTNRANVAFGLCSAAAANTLLDDGAGPAASFSGAMIYKVDGGTVWKTVASIGTTQSIHTSLTSAGGASYQALGILIQPVSATIAEISYFVDGVQLIDANSSPNRPIKDSITYTGAAVGYLRLYIKTGSANAETLNVDYVGAEKLRSTF